MILNYVKKETFRTDTSYFPFYISKVCKKDVKEDKKY